MTNPARDQLLQRNLEWATLIAKKIHRTLPPSFDEADLVQVAWVELWKRSELFKGKLDNNAHFQGYAYLYVRGACLMSVRRGTFVEATHEELVTWDADDHGRSHPDGPPGGYRGDPIAEPLDPAPIPGEHTERMREILGNEQRIGFQRHIVRRRMAGMPFVDRLLIEQVLEGKSMDEMARSRGISTLKLSRRISAVVKRLK